jgi:hypothetical protein
VFRPDADRLPTLRAEQWSLFDQLVNAERRRAASGKRREPFLVVYADQATLITHPDLGLAGGLPEVEEGDIRALLAAGLVEGGPNDTVLQVSGYGEHVYDLRQSRPDPLARAMARVEELEAELARSSDHELAHAGRIDLLGDRVASIVGALVSLILIAVFGYATIVLLQAGSAPASAGFGVLVFLTAYSFINTAFGIGPIDIGSWVRRRFSPVVSKRLREWLEPK